MQQGRQTGLKECTAVGFFVVVQCFQQPLRFVLLVEHFIVPKFGAGHDGAGGLHLFGDFEFTSNHEKTADWLYNNC